MAFFDQIILAFLVSVCCFLLCLNGESKITPGERSKIINLHNTFRASVTPSASDMEKMVRCMIHSRVATYTGGWLVSNHMRTILCRGPYILIIIMLL